MISLDYFLIGAGLVGLFFGYQKGLISQFAGLLGYGAGAILAIYFSDSAGEFLKNFLPFKEGLALKVSSMAILFILAIIGVRLILKAVEKGVNAVYLGTANRLAGAVLGLLKYVLVFGFFVVWFHKLNSLIPIVDESYFTDSKIYTLLKGVLDSQTT